MRLIDADKLKKDVLDLQDCYNGFSDTYDKACIIGVIDEQPSAQPELIEQIKWERDTAIQQLKELGYGLGQKPRMDAPTNKSERKKGKWTEKHHAYSDEESVIEEWQSCRCSECGRYDTRPYMYYFSEPNYCSYCGADMRGEK